ncbi:hypothetical protein HZ993_03015 [Rhodoferax sp. AJA081-3]|uniref:hypothetical protein n=1 Tax=Rhodoferax sp. AJA081-3 TaxID=2752316 RepID=UPI001AE094BC|nr:hypothetical protein [Rhodoferax sp. AJA081-3]QTN28831.1 hypothetical protein HZ993_03015 [Rhodoferax sp. AJA081-3]
MDIRQISIRYRQDHDRILVDINTGSGTEVQVWLTRRMSLRLWPLLNRVVIDHFAIPQDAKTDGFVDLAAMDVQTKALLADFNREEAMQKADFSTPYQTSVTQRPMGPNPLVVTEVSLTPYGNGKLQLNFTEVLDEPPSSRGFQIDLSSELVFAVIKLLGNALEQAQWEVGQHSAVPLAAEPDVADEIDLSPDATRPTYLN